MRWEDGIYSSRAKTTTRKAYSLDLSSSSDCNDAILSVVQDVCLSTCPDGKCVIIEDVYLNYYRNGRDFCPSHSHKESRQIIISLGATRTLKVGKKDYLMENGDVIIFGSSNHGIKQEENIHEGRISIAVFTRLYDTTDSSKQSLDYIE